MATPSNSPAGASGGGRAGPSWTRFRLVGAAVGLALLVAAVVLVVTHASSVSGALSAIAHPRPATVLWLVGTILIAVPMGAASQIIMLWRFSRTRVGLGEMSALVSVATVLNYLPLWPGVFGRIAWHRVVNGIGVMDAGKAIVSVRLLGLMTGLLLLGLVWADGIVFDVPDIRWAWLVLAGALSLPAVVPGLRCVAAAAVLKWGDLYIRQFQYVLVFDLMAIEIDATTGMALAGISSVAMSVPFIGSGPGLREWAVGWMTTVVNRLPDALVIGVMADLVLRVATLVVMLPVGVVSALWLRRRLREVQESVGSTPRSSTVNSDSNT